MKSFYVLKTVDHKVYAGSSLHAGEDGEFTLSNLFHNSEYYFAQMNSNYLGGEKKVKFHILDPIKLEMRVNVKGQWIPHLQKMGVDTQIIHTIR